MRAVAQFILVAGLCLGGCKPSGRMSSAASKPAAAAEAGCATCIFHMKGVTGCKLAVKIDGRAYLVEGSGIDDHGDAHAADGLCNAVRQARVRGHVKDDKFVASMIELLP